MLSHLNVKQKDDEIFLNQFGKRLRNLRKEHGLSQEELANDANIPINQIGRIERSEINTSIVTIYKITKALKINLVDFFCEGFENQL